MIHLLSLILRSCPCIRWKSRYYETFTYCHPRKCQYSQVSLGGGLYFALSQYCLLVSVVDALYQLKAAAC